MYDVAIIGAGVSGAAIARRLSRYRLRVALLERCVDVSFGVSKANSGIIHAGFHHSPSSLKARLEIEGNRAFDGLQAELGFPFRRAGIVVAAFSVEEMKTVERLYAQGVENGAPDIQIVGRDRLLALEPALSRDVVGGLFAPSGGIIEPYRFVFALAESAAANGVRLFTGWEAVGAHRQGDEWRIVSAAGEELAARWVVNAAGLRADGVSAMFGAEQFTILPRKGEEFILDKGSAGPPSRVIFPVPARTSKGVLVIPTVEGTVMLGPTADEGGDKEDTTTTPENLDRVFRLASQMVPRISKRDIITSFAGLRPTLPGDDFMIELSRAAPCFVQVAGIQSPGLTASPAIAERVKDLLKSGGLELREKTEWQPGIPRVNRTRDHAPRELDRLVARDPAYAHLVCRCEGVSEAEVVEAIRKGHTTLDGIKYYTRAGMGRCQGGFCTYRIMHLVARETGLPLERITKHGPGSELVLGRIGSPP
ncbi:MAG: NAD(P)/FAD-dependent oxidoreductase [Spirochaetia bacterium]